jgi:hypothetical protein
VVREPNLTGTSFTVTTPLVSGGRYRIWIRAISTTGEVGRWSTTLDFSVAATDSIRSEEASLNDLSQLDVLDGLLVKVLHNHVQSGNVAVRHDTAWTPVPSPEPPPLDPNASINTDADLIEIDALMHDIVTDLLFSNPIT